MTATKQEQIIINLSLNSVEARWLRDVMQNPLHGQSTDAEEVSERQHRINLFIVLQDVWNP